MSVPALITRVFHRFTVHYKLAGATFFRERLAKKLDRYMICGKITQF